MARAFLALGLAFLVGCSARQQSRDAVQPPNAVLADTTLGNHHGVGDCSGCHGDQGVGTPEGPSLVDGTWKLGDGSYEWLLHMTRHGGWGMRDRGDEPRPMRGPTALDSTQVRQVATYVWGISRERRPANETRP